MLALAPTRPGSRFPSHDLESNTLYRLLPASVRLTLASRAHDLASEVWVRFIGIRSRRWRSSLHSVAAFFPPHPDGQTFIAYHQDREIEATR
jgi:hypothetical protein